MRVHLFKIVALLSILLLASCSQKGAGGEGEKKEGGEAASVAEVTVTKVTRADVMAEITVTGTIAAPPNQDVKVSALVPGRIASMSVAEGDHVQQGQAMAKIEDRPFLDQITQAEAGVSQAKANVENAKLNRERNENLFQRGIAARKDLEDARTQLTVNEAALRQSEAALALLRLQLSRTEVKAPISGTVVKRFVSVGEQVDGTGAQPLFELANLGEVELFGNIPATYLSKIRVGQNLDIITNSLPGKTLNGHVVAISPAIDPATDVGMVRIRIANAGGGLRLGMFLTARLPLETHAHALVLPPQAIYRDEKGEPVVFKVAGDNATSTDVKLGLESKERVEVLEGVEEGQTVIFTGGYGLGEKAKVKIAAAPAAPAAKGKE